MFGTGMVVILPFILSGVNTRLCDSKLWVILLLKVVQVKLKLRLLEDILVSFNMLQHKSPIRVIVVL